MVYQLILGQASFRVDCVVVDAPRKPFDVESEHC